MAGSRQTQTRSRQQSIRKRIFTFVGALILLSLLGSTFSLYRITEVNRSLMAINQVSVPLGRLLVQMQADAEVFRRELDRGLGYSHWRDPHWKPRAVPTWVGEVLGNEVTRARELVSKAEPDRRAKWENWLDSITTGLNSLREEAGRLYVALRDKNETAASEIYPRWNRQMADWFNQLQWGVNEYDRYLRQGFSEASSSVAELRTGLEMILIAVVSLSLLLLWLGERALRPLEDLTRLARQITRRGLRKEDKALLAEVPVSRMDEVSQLAREFHGMATSLLEREKMVEAQKLRLEDQNHQLREMGALNENILYSIRAVLIVTGTDGRITRCNPQAMRWLGEGVLGSVLLSWPQIRAFAGSEHWFEKLRETRQGFRIEPVTVGDRVYGGHLMQLKHDREVEGTILVLDDLTEEMDLQERLRRAENLAAVGRMSAQVAHEVRNPLHSIGLEAEVAVEMAAKLGDSGLKQSLQSILASVDRLEKITENYLKLSRLSAGERTVFDLGEVLESVLATYSQVCESEKIHVEWTRPRGVRLDVMGDRDLLEQVLGNLMRNALQALENRPKSEKKPEVRWALGTLESGRVWIQIADNGPGIAPAIRERLFTPFVTTRAQGTGLGLSFVKKVLEDHHGTIECLDRPEGGACFQILLPPVSVTASQEAPQAPEVNAHA